MFLLDATGSMAPHIAAAKLAIDGTAGLPHHPPHT